MPDTGPNGCIAAVSQRGQHYWCDLHAPHIGTPHGNSEGNLVWRGVGSEEDFQAAWRRADPEGER